MRSRLVAVCSLFVIILMAGGSALAHHGSGVSYDLSKMVTMQGTVTEFQWRNPHVYVMYDVKDAQGNVVNWGAETHAPVVCENQDHWTKSTLKPGDKITRRRIHDSEKIGSTSAGSGGGVCVSCR